MDLTWLCTAPPLFVHCVTYTLLHNILPYVQSADITSLHTRQTRGKWDFSKLVNSNKKSTIFHDWFTHSHHQQDHILPTFREFIPICCSVFHHDVRKLNDTLEECFTTAILNTTPLLSITLISTCTFHPQNTFHSNKGVKRKHVFNIRKHQAVFSPIGRLNSSICVF